MGMTGETNLKFIFQKMWPNATFARTLNGHNAAVSFLVEGLTWAALDLWSQNHPQVGGTCPGHCPSS